MRTIELVLAGALALGVANDWKSVTPELELAFPRDHGAHPAYQTEWWYLTGNVADEDGRRFGFQLTIFRRGLDPAPAAPGASPLRARQVLAGHLAVTDVATGRTVLAERLRRAGSPLASAAVGELDLVLEDWSFARADDGLLVVRAADPARGLGLALELEPNKPLVLHGDGGYSRKGRDPGNASAYVSWTRLAAAGRLTVGGEAREVRGEAWFDHEFGTSVLDDDVVGWDWFGLQLDGGRELMLFVVREEGGGVAPTSAGTLVEADGTAVPLGREDFAVEALAAWTSPRTGARYPARWRIELRERELELVVVPLVADAELATGGSTGVVYWEGPVEVSGDARGRGYAELTGYAGSMGARF